MASIETAELMIGVRPEITNNLMGMPGQESLGVESRTVEPIELVATFPSITGEGRILSGALCSSPGETTVGDTAAAPWLCRLGTWVNNNPFLAMAIVAGIYVATKNGRK